MSFAYVHEGFCPICEKAVRFESTNKWHRDYLLCTECGSVPRERALAVVLENQFPNWRILPTHESSPIDRGISKKIREQAGLYTGSQYLPNEQPGTVVNGFRNENLEKQTFGDKSFSLVISLDVMEHVNEPEAAFKDIARTLVDGGAYLFSVPTYKEQTESKRAARHMPDGTIEHYAKPEYHGNPVGNNDSLVTFRYGYDLPELIHAWSDLDVEVFRFHNHHLGIIGEMTEIYLCRKNKPNTVANTEPTQAQEV